MRFHTRSGFDLRPSLPVLARLVMVVRTPPRPKDRSSFVLRPCPTPVGLRWVAGVLWFLCGLDLTFGPHPQLFDEHEGRWPVASGRLLTLVAELNCPRREHICFRKLRRRHASPCSTRPSVARRAPSIPRRLPSLGRSARSRQ